MICAVCECVSGGWGSSQLTLKEVQGGVAGLLEWQADLDVYEEHWKTLYCVGTSRLQRR
jgi:hypothetical protein